MELYLGGSYDKVCIQESKKNNNLFILQTFYDLRSMKTEKVKCLIELPEIHFMLDSGAFTFMNSGKKVAWEQYINEYIEFINKWDIDRFIELDLYGVLGVENTEHIRKYIEKKTGKKPIPVYHGTLPVSYFRELCQEYSYVAISATGTIESSKWTRNKKALKQMIKIGHSYGTKLHGLGYTRLENINNPEVQFDSVDSSSWLYGSRFGVMYKTKQGKVIQINAKDYKTGIRRTHDDWIKINMPVWIDKQKELYYNK